MGLVIAAFILFVAVSVRGVAGGGAGRFDTDGAFIAGMVPHHKAAVDMAQTALDRSARRRVRALARRIIDTQTEEMSRLRMSHLRLYGTSLSSMNPDAMPSMPGMSDGAEISAADLAAAPEFDRAFIDAMVPHHRAAVRMAKYELAHGRDPGLRKIARAIISEQSAEIASLERWRTRWYGSR